MEITENIKEYFTFPSIENEIGEIERVAEEYAKDDPQAFVSKFVEVAKAGQLVELTDEEWNNLENTDSLDVKAGDWERVNYHASEVNRDWQSLKEKIVQGETLDAPIIVKIGGVLHLVSGNTRLMVARAADIKPKVLIVDMNV